MNQSITAELAGVMPSVIESGLLTSIASMEMPDGLTTDNGSPSGNFLPVAGLQSISCIDAPMSTSRVEATEAKGLAEIEASRFRHVLMNGYYPQIPDGIDVGWRVVMQQVLNGRVVDVLTYDLLGSEPDSQTRMTRLSMRFVSV